MFRLRRRRKSCCQVGLGNRSRFAIVWIGTGFPVTTRPATPSPSRHIAPVVIFTSRSSRRGFRRLLDALRQFLDPLLEGEDLLGQALDRLPFRIGRSRHAGRIVVDVPFAVDYAPGSRDRRIGRTSLFTTDPEPIFESCDANRPRIAAPARRSRCPRVVGCRLPLVPARPAQRSRRGTG